MAPASFLGVLSGDTLSGPAWQDIQQVQQSNSKDRRETQHSSALSGRHTAAEVLVAINTARNLECVQAVCVCVWGGGF